MLPSGPDPKFIKSFFKGSHGPQFRHPRGRDPKYRKRLQRSALQGDSARNTYFIILAMGLGLLLTPYGIILFLPDYSIAQRIAAFIVALIGFLCPLLAIRCALKTNAKIRQLTDELHNGSSDRSGSRDGI